MAATRLIALHRNSGKSLLRCLQDRIDYALNPDKTENGTLVSSYSCDPKTAAEEFLLTKRLYHQQTGLDTESDVIAYQIRQSFKPGEITPEEANRLGYETAMRWTKGNHAFLVATHTDRSHIHNHIIYNSTKLDGLHKYRDFLRSGLALQRVSDTVCVEAGLSIITPRPQRERVKYEYDQDTFRNAIRLAMDEALRKKPRDYEEFLRFLREAGYEVKPGKYTAVKGPGQKRFIRFRSLGNGYSDDEIRTVIAGNAIHRPKRKSVQVHHVVQFSLILDLQQKLDEKGPAYERWASVFNLKQMANVMLFLNENHIDSIGDLVSQTEDTLQRTDSLQAQIRKCDERLEEISALKKNIINYSKTRDTYVSTDRKSKKKKKRKRKRRTSVKAKSHGLRSPQKGADRGYFFVFYFDIIC